MSKDDISTDSAHRPQKADNTSDHKSFQEQLEGQIKLLTRELKESQRDIILKLTRIVAERSRETGSHIQRVAELSYLLAQKTGLDNTQADILRLASPMHDVGKVVIPDTILHKPGPLSDEEFEIMKTHTTAGYEMLKGSRRKVLQTAAIIALQHHEKYNGKGYPLGLKGERINILGRITQIADVFDALCSKRVYRPAWDIQIIIEHFEKHRGQYYDPKLVDLLLENVQEFLSVREKYPDQRQVENHTIVKWENQKITHPTVVGVADNWKKLSQPQKVLVCHKAPQISQQIETILGECGYRSEIFSDYKKLWMRFSEDESTRVCILDLDDDGRKSIDLCRKIRSVNGNHYTYIIMLTDGADNGLLSQAKEAGADTWIPLPLNDDSIRSCMSAAQRIVDLQDELIAARETMRHQATRDQLTGIWNRPAILDILATELNRANREKTSIGLVLADIDQFKMINDTYGHKSGDIVLQQTAERIKNAIRPYDGFARYGGEEFLLVLPGCDMTFAAYVAERLRNAVCANPIKIGDIEIPVSISAGVASKRGQENISSDDFIQHADDALYLAKACGRNRIKTTEKLNQAI